MACYFRCLAAAYPARSASAVASAAPPSRLRQPLSGTPPPPSHPAPSTRPSRNNSRLAHYPADTPLPLDRPSSRHSPRQSARPRLAAAYPGPDLASLLREALYAPQSVSNCPSRPGSQAVYPSVLRQWSEKLSSLFPSALQSPDLLSPHPTPAGICPTSALRSQRLFAPSNLRSVPTSVPGR